MRHPSPVPPEYAQNAAYTPQDVLPLHLRLRDNPLRDDPENKTLHTGQAHT